MAADRERLRAALAAACDDLRAARPVGSSHWVGELSTSALSTATAVSALSLLGEAADSPLIARGVDWLASHGNADGGWGDTDRSFSNISTTMLTVAAFHLAGQAAEQAGRLAAAEQYIAAQGGLAGLRKRYGRDKTFAVPILANSALAGRVPWSDVAPLPFELAALPQRLYRFLRLPVVSYAIPALVAIGQLRFFHRPPANPLVRWWRQRSVAASLRVLERMQPQSGGYLEAIPLTSFVVMSLAATGRRDHPVAQRGAAFLRSAVLADGSWPIDVNLATWLTSLSVGALAAAEPDWDRRLQDERPHGVDDCLNWLLQCQHLQRHPFTGADPGGWGWTDLSGAVPDADDTPAALLALARFRELPECREETRTRIDAAARAGIDWLLGLQNADGGWPTFCRGWGQLPFDRSGADLTAHALRALLAWEASPAPSDFARQRLARALRGGWNYLGNSQREDGSWVPLWFGNQRHPAEENPVYGTAKVLLAYGEAGRDAEPRPRKALDWLAHQLLAESGPDSVEEVALAVEALAACERAGRETAERRAAYQQGLDWLLRAVETRDHLKAAPIGLYFARLWYYERLYPLAFTVAALGRARAVSECPETSEQPWSSLPGVPSAAAEETTRAGEVSR
ncbi:MAG: prenyltransferase/squalene oxidase repeat-containing protein [Pirellulales bacterium]